MNPAKASVTPGTRRLPLCALLLMCLQVPMVLTAQTTADRASVNRVVELLFSSAGDWGDEVVPLSGAWSVTIASFAKGDSREILIPARVGQEFKVKGTSESFGTDVDICVYGPQGNPVACDTLEDNYPIARFTAKAEGTYRAVMTAVSVEGGGTSYAGMIVLRMLDQGEVR